MHKIQHASKRNKVKVNKRNFLPISLSWDSNSRSTIKSFPWPLQKTKARYCISTTQALEPVMSKLNSVPNPHTILL